MAGAAVGSNLIMSEYIYNILEFEVFEVWDPLAFEFGFYIFLDLEF